MGEVTHSPFEFVRACLAAVDERGDFVVRVPIDSDLADAIRIGEAADERLRLLANALRGAEHNGHAAAAFSMTSPHVREVLDE